MQHELNLYNLYEVCQCASSNIIYYDGTRKHLSNYTELRKYVSYLSELFENLFLSRSVICCLIKPNLGLPAIILGILKVSSTFAFLDIHKPYESLQTFQKYLEVKTLIVEESYFKNLKSKLCCCWKPLNQFHAYSDFIILHSAECRKDGCPCSKKFNKCESQFDIAYAVQTSGTTGKPKVVQVPHQCIAANIVDFRSRFSVTSDDVILQSTKITFDPSIIEIFLSLSSSANIVIVADHIKSSPKKLIDIIVNENVTVFQGTPSLICGFGEDILKNTLLHGKSSLRILAFGGEECPSMNKLKRWKSSDNKTIIYNLYGLTELSCWASCYKIDFSSITSLSSVPIGDPLLDTKFEIHNEDGRVADKGELYIGGSNRFCLVNDEKWPDNIEHFMRPTGDLVFQAPDGFIYFEGRSDSVIKYMGHKISLQQVNNFIENFPEVVHHFVHYDSSSAKLYLFVVWASKNSCNEVEHILSSSMKKAISNLPAVIVVPVAFIPVTKHGKADVEQLMHVVDETKQRKICLERNVFDILTTLWKSYTNQDDILENESFILNGGNSISAVQFAADMEWKLQLQLPLLVEKLLNASFKVVKNYVKSCLEEEHQPNQSCKNDIESAPQPSTKKKRYNTAYCFKSVCKQGFTGCCNHLNRCFSKQSVCSSSKKLHFCLSFTCDLKKCIDATPCILYLPHTEELLIFIGSHFGIFSCIDVKKQSEKWQVSISGRIESSACISACGNFVLFGSYDHHIYCICLSNGTIQWKYKADAEVKSSPSVSSDNKVYVGSHDKHLYAIDVKSGLLVWKRQVACGSIFSSPAIIETIGAVAIGTLDGVLALYQMESGEVLWKSSLGKPLFSSPLVTSNCILIGSTDKFFLCVDFKGKEKFKYLTEGPIFSSAMCHKDFQDRFVFGCHDFYVYCIEKSGKLIWRTQCDSAVYGTPFIFKWNDFYFVCVASSQGTLYVFQFTDGKVIFSWKCPGEVFSSPVILNDVLAIGCRDNNVYCFNLNGIVES